MSEQKVPKNLQATPSSQAGRKMALKNFEEWLQDSGLIPPIESGENDWIIGAGQGWKAALEWALTKEVGKEYGRVYQYILSDYLREELDD